MGLSDWLKLSHFIEFVDTSHNAKTFFIILCLISYKLVSFAFYTGFIFVKVRTGRCNSTELNRHGLVSEELANVKQQCIRTTVWTPSNDVGDRLAWFTSRTR